MSDSTSTERLAVLERDVEHLKDSHLENKDEVIKRLETLENQQRDLLLELSRYRGSWGTILMIASALWGAFTIFKDYLFKDSK